MFYDKIDYGNVAKIRSLIKFHKSHVLLIFVKLHDDNRGCLERELIVFKITKNTLCVDLQYPKI